MIAKYNNLVFVDCEAVGGCPATGFLTEFGAVAYADRATFHGVVVPSHPSAANPAVPVAEDVPGKGDFVRVFTQFDQWLREHIKGRPSMVSDNPAYDWQWINDGFWRVLDQNPLGHSARRLSDFYAGLMNDFTDTQSWKALRTTAHDHHPVHDALGNLEAFERLLKGERGPAKRS